MQIISFSLKNLEINMDPRRKKIIFSMLVNNFLLEQSNLTAKILRYHTIILEHIRQRVYSWNRIKFIIALIRKRRKRDAERRVWAYVRNQNFFEDLMQSRDLIGLWPNYFRVEKTSFDRICDLVREKMTKEETNMRRTIPLEKRVAIGLYRLASGDTFIRISYAFGIGTSTAHTICSEFEQALTDIRDDHIHFPSNDLEISLEIDKFEEKYNFPQIAGIVDGSHIPIRAPFTNKVDYYNRKQIYSVNLQVIANADLEILHASVGYPGSIHDARVWRLSGLFFKAERGDILHSPSRDIRGKTVRPLIATDSAYPATSWLIKPYQYGPNLTPRKRKFNKVFSGMRCTVERSLGLLKNRWRILLEQNYQTLESIPNCVMACVVLHNFCLRLNDVIGMDETDASFDGDEDDVNPNVFGNVDIREVIFEYMSRNGYL